ncbi:venom metalloproteinase BumaMPs1-like isoform X2 [Rhipicephalus microplus]|uniref:venom metalloproteinase BumaMPs1-like isoform X2 n=1 Tax=Rhipicephalus microplus TaxID=6941 RepID=UPI003F6B1D34
MFIIYICYWTVLLEVEAHSSENSSPPDSTTQSPLHAIEVSLELGQLNPPIRVVLVAYQSTSEEKPDYISFTPSGDVDADGTVEKLREYAAKSSSIRQSDFVLLFTQCRIVDVSGDNETQEILGIAPLEGICSNYSVAVVKDVVGRYTGKHSLVHEMGHLFGANHDGEGSSVNCSAADGYIMSPNSHGKHHEEFSTCSLTAVSKYVNSEAAECLREAASDSAIGVYPFKHLSYDDTPKYDDDESPEE